MELLEESQLLCISTKFHLIGIKLNWISGFSISMLWGEILLDLFHCMIFYKISKLYNIVIGVNEGKLFLIYFHYVSLDW